MEYFCRFLEFISYSRLAKFFVQIMFRLKLKSHLDIQISRMLISYLKAFSKSLCISRLIWISIHVKLLREIAYSLSILYPLRTPSIRNEIISVHFRNLLILAHSSSTHTHKRLFYSTLVSAPVPNSLSDYSNRNKFHSTLRNPFPSSTLLRMFTLRRRDQRNPFEINSKAFAQRPR